MILLLILIIITAACILVVQLLRAIQKIAVPPAGVDDEVPE